MEVNLLEEIIFTLAEQLSLEADDITVDSDITGELGADSLDIVELCDIFERKYQITATDEDIMSLSTVESVYDMIANKLGLVQKSDKKNKDQISW
ncbi:MAG: acyl carrier protein [Clostridia bacterium]|nr:acyl carrier protein [Clostridia bacterium]